MSEINYLLKFPVQAKGPFNDRIDAIETLFKLDKDLKDRGHKHGIYNMRCITTIDNSEEGTAYCRVTTYGDLSYIKEFSKHFIETLDIRDEFNADDTTLKEAKEFKKIIQR